MRSTRGAKGLLPSACDEAGSLEGCRILQGIRYSRCNHRRQVIDYRMQVFHQVNEYFFPLYDVLGWQAVERRFSPVHL